MGLAARLGLPLAACQGPVRLGSAHLRVVGLPAARLGCGRLGSAR